jgi:hypothetical protein
MKIINAVCSRNFESLTKWTPTITITWPWRVGPRCQDGNYNRCNFPTLSFVLWTSTLQSSSAQIPVAGENENTPWSALGVSNISKIQAQPRRVGRRCQYGDYNRCNFATLSLVLWPNMLQSYSAQIAMVGENENVPWSALGVSNISKIQAPTRARLSSTPRRWL